MDIICINDHFSQDLELYFQKYGIIKPIRDKVYTIREIVKNTVGEKGVLLEELINPPTPSISPLTGFKGMREQDWKLSRFRTLSGDLINEEMIKQVVTK